MIHTDQWNKVYNTSSKIAKEYVRLGYDSIDNYTSEEIEIIKTGEGIMLEQEQFVVNYKNHKPQYGTLGIAPQTGMLGIFVEQDFYILPKHYMMAEDINEFIEEKLKLYPEFKL